MTFLLSFLSISGKKVAQHLQTLYGPPPIIQPEYGMFNDTHVPVTIITRILSSAYVPFVIVPAFIVGIIFFIIRGLKNSDKNNPKNRRT